MTTADLFRRWSPYACICLGVIALFAALGQLRPVRVGDGSEYYALSVAICATHRPWMTRQSFDAYQELYASQEIRDMAPGDKLAGSFPALRLGETWDFNHFWFYSLLASLCLKAAALLGIRAGVHAGFLMLHGLLACGVACLAYRHFRGRGLFLVLLLTLGSPALWFLDKVHTEWFTFCTALGAVVLMCARRHTGAALLLAAAATQNPSFALVALVPLGYRAALERARPYGPVEVLLLVATAILLLLHPAYYFLRHGVATPQLLAGDAALGLHWKSFPIWLFDPDIGLLPNWPVGVFLLAVAGAVWLADRRRSRPDARLTVFCLAYLAVSLYAHASTTNINSGGTPGLARYALWYIPLAFAPLLAQLPGLSRPRRALVLAGAAILALAQLPLYQPRHPESYLTPTVFSRFLQTRLPGLYNPPPEVFLERYTPYGERVHPLDLKGALGPDCRKLLLRPGDHAGGVWAPPGCGFDQSRLDALAATLPARDPGGDYLRLSEEQAQSLRGGAAPGP